MAADDATHPPRAALVTGGSGRLGARICHGLAQAGARVAIGYNSDPAAAEALAADLPGAIAVHADMADPLGTEAAVQTAATTFGALDTLVVASGVASAGHSIDAGDLDAFTPEIWDELMAVNIRGPYLAARAAAPHLRASGHGRIVLIGSTIGHGPWGAGAIYAPSKGMVSVLARYLATALAPDVAVNCVAPGLMEGTKMSKGAPEAFIERWKDRAVTGRTTSLDEVARHVLAFCQSSTVTGQVLIADGGINYG